MDVITSHKIAFISFIPFITASTVMVSAQRPSFRGFCPLIGACLTIYLLCQFLPHILTGGMYEAEFFHVYPGISITLRIDGIGLLFAGTVSVIWLLTELYRISYMRVLSEYVRTQDLICSSALMGGTLGVAVSGNLFTLFLFYLLTTVFTYAIMPVSQERVPGKYQGMMKGYSFFISKAFLLSALIMFYSECSTLDFSQKGIVEGIFPDGADTHKVIISFLMCLAGLSFTPVMLLFQNTVHSKETLLPESIMINVVAVTAGAYAMCRVMLSAYGVNLLQETHLGLMTVYIFSAIMILTSITALIHTNLHSKLVHSTVSQLSYVILGVAILSPQGITGGLIHILNHTFAKAALFFCCCNLIILAGVHDIRNMRGTGYLLPVTLGVFFLASLVMIGIPPFSGFVTVWYLGIGAIGINNMTVLTVILVSCFLNAACFLPVSIQAFDKNRKQTEKNSLFIKKKEHWYFVLYIPLIVTSAFSVYLGVWPDSLLEIISDFIGM